MRKAIPFILLLSFSLVSKAQPVEYYLNNTLRFVTANNDTVPFPFMGGFIAPQFNEIDLNNDNVKDLVVFDRNGNKLMTFLNKGVAGQVSYIYAPQYEFFFPELANWVLLRDYNCDGKEDIFSGSQQSGITVYKNTSTGNSLQFTHVVTDLLDSAGDNIYALVLDIPAIDDIDGDGDLDIMAFGVLGGSAQYYRNKRVEKNLSCEALDFKLVDFCWGSFAEGGLSNTIFLGDNCFGLKFYPKNAVHSGSMLLTLDNDEDGDKELILSDVDYPDFKLLVNGKKETSWPWDTITSYSTGFPFTSKGVYIDKFPAGFYLDVNNDGIKDFIATSNEAVAASNLHQNWYYRNDGKTNKPNLQLVDSGFLQNKTVDFGSQTAPALFDADGDGDLDLVVSNRGNYRLTLNGSDQLALFENIGSSSNAIFKLKDENYLNIKADNLTGVYPTFADLNGDGLQDLVLGLLSGRMRYYTNTGSATVPAFTLTNDSLGSIDAGVLAAPHFYDVNGDSALDIILGNSAGFFRYHQNKGSKTNPVFYASHDVDSVGKVLVNNWFYNYEFDTSIVPIDSFRTFETEGHSNTWIADLDQDGSPEMICGSKSGKIFVYTMDLFNLTDSFTEWVDYFVMPHNGQKAKVDFGARTSVAMMNADGDGRLDMLIGNSRGGLHYLNSRYTPLDTILNSSVSLPALELSLYPNPTNGTVNLQSGLSLTGELQIDLVDVFGRNLGSWTWDALTENEKSLDVSGVASGTYFLRVTHPNYRQEVFRLSVVR